MSNLSDKNIYRLAMKDDLGRDDLELIYAPIADSMLLVSHEEADALEQAVAEPGESELSEIVETLLEGIPAEQRDSKVNHVDEFLLMYVLPNYTCNFSCSYCFSAKGRSRKVLDKAHLKAALDYFIDSGRVSSRRLAISYLGGGEPTLSWDVVKFGLKYADSRAREHGIEMMTTIVTNGSRITDDMVAVLSEHNVLVRVSFEILEEIQNLQRGQYGAVCQGLDRLSKSRRKPMVRSMITPDNVHRMSEMIELLHQRFPYVGQVLFDPITSKETFHEVPATQAFYDAYYTHFLQARLLGKEYGIEVACAPLRNLNMVVERFCTGEFCLTPEGTITLCHQISSPNESNYSNYIYASVNAEGKIEIDDEKFRKLIATHTVYSHPRCKDCFVKWNCGGGCMMQNSQYTDEIRQVICAFTRRFSKTLLVERFGQQLLDEGTTLAEYIHDNYDTDTALKQ